MKPIDLPLLGDVLFYSVSSWLLAVGILRYFRMPLPLALLTSTLLALAVGGISFLAIYSKHRKRALSRAQKERREKLMLHLALERPDAAEDLLARAFSADGCTAERKGDGLFIDGRLAVPLFTMQPASADAVAQILRGHGDVPFRVLANALTPEAEKLLSTFGKDCTCADEIFSLFERTGTMPKRLICGSLPRRTVKMKLRHTFSRRNARPFFVSGALLLIMSLVALFPLYYVITGGLLLAVSVCVRVFGYA